MIIITAERFKDENVKYAFSSVVEAERHLTVLFGCPGETVTLKRGDYLTAVEVASPSDLLEALVDLRGDMPAVQGGICHYCGRDYRADIADGNGEDIQDLCPSDDCPSYLADRAIAKAQGGA